MTTRAAGTGTTGTTAPRSLTARLLASMARTGADMNYASRRLIELQAGADPRR